MAKIDHIGIVVKSIDDALKLYTDLLGMGVVDRQLVHGTIELVVTKGQQNTHARAN